MRSGTRLLAGLFLVLALLGAQDHAVTSTRDPVSQLIVAAVIVAVFVLLAMEKAHRVLVIFAAVALIWLITYLTPYRLISLEASQEALDFNVILLLASMMAVVAVLKSTGVFSYAVARMLRAARGRPVLIIAALLWFTGLLSSVADNVTTVIFTTPMALEIARRLRVRSASILLPMVIASNVGGTATLIGDPPNILIGSGAGLSFLDFVVNLTGPVLIMLVLVEFHASRYFRQDYRAGVPRIDTADLALPPLEHHTLLRWGLAISLLIFIGFLTHTVTGMPASVPAAVGAAALLVVQDILHLRRRDPSLQERVHGILAIIEREIEWPTLSFFAFLFIAVGAAVATGLIDTLSHGLATFIDFGSATFGLSPTGTLFFAALLILWVSGLLSALIDNIPYVAVTIPIIASLTGRLEGDTQVLWWALSLGACLGGNGTAIGASANVTVVGLAERAGEHIGFGQFARYGARVTLLTLLVAAGYLAAQIFLGATVAHVGTIAVLVVAFLARTFFISRRDIRDA